MDLFGNKEHDTRHDAVEQQLRGLVEQVAQLTIELGEARADIARLQAQLDTKMDAPDAEAMDEELAEAKAKLGAAKSASEEAWNEIQPQLLASLAKVRDAIDKAGAREPDPTDE